MEQNQHIHARDGVSEPKDAITRTYSLAAVALAPDSIEPSARGGATLTQIEGDGGVYLIGGATRDAQCFSDVHRFDIATRTWTRVTPASGSDTFTARSGHSAVALGRRIVVFGGLDLHAGEVFNDVHIFDTRTHQWTKAEIADGEVPLPRNAHAATLLPQTRTDVAHERHQMLVFGGSSPLDGVMSDVFVLALPHDNEDEDAAAGTSEPLVWERIESIGGESPEARELHCATLLPPSSPPPSRASPAPSVICFSGGRNAAGGICTDMAMLDTRAWHWTLVPICEWNRCSHAVGRVGDALVSFGGFDGTALRSDCWVYADAAESWLCVNDPLEDQHNGDTSSKCNMDQPETTATAPADLARFGHASCSVTLPPNWLEPAAAAVGAEGKTATALLVFGGMTASRDLNDLVLIAQQHCE